MYAYVHNTRVVWRKKNNPETYTHTHKPDQRFSHFFPSLRAKTTQCPRKYIYNTGYNNNKRIIDHHVLSGSDSPQERWAFVYTKLLTDGWTGRKGARALRVNTICIHAVHTNVHVVQYIYIGREFVQTVCVMRTSVQGQMQPIALFKITSKELMGIHIGNLDGSRRVGIDIIYKRIREY